MNGRASVRKVMRVTAPFGLWALMAGGCGDNTEEKLRAAKLAQGCSINSDCEGELVCVFERCHVACEADEDCDPPLRCVRGEEAGSNVCQLEDEIGCKIDKDCPGDQVCAVDDECRDSCRSDSECISGQVCAASDECASTDPAKDELDAGRNIVLEGGAGGAGGGPSTGGENGGEGNATAGGAGGVPTEGEGASAGQTSGSAGEASGAAGESTGGVGPGPVGEYVESSDGVEAVENDDREHALPAAATASLFFTQGDEDWFKVTAPKDGRAHVLELTLEQQAGLRTGVDALAGADFALIGSTSTAAGVTASMYVTVGPGTTTLLRFWPYSGVSSAQGKRLDVALQMTAEEDPHEPNNSSETATSIGVGTQVSGRFINPFVSATDQPSDDWYVIELSEGTASLELMQAPAGGRLQITREDANGVSSTIQTPQPGVTGTWPFSVPATGTYFIHFARYTGFLPFTAGAKPPFVTEPYTFRVLQ